MLSKVVENKTIVQKSGYNSYKLRSNQFHTVYGLMTSVFDKVVLDNLKVRAIDPDFIHLTPLFIS